MSGMASDDDHADLTYAVHETFLGGMLGRLVSRHETLLEALAIATEPQQKPCGRSWAANRLAAARLESLRQLSLPRALEGPPTEAALL